MIFLNRPIVLLMAGAIISLSTSALAQMPPSSLVAASGSEPEFSALLGDLSSNNKALAFWKDVKTAEAFMSKKEPRKAISTLSNLPPRPAPELSFGETFYAELYKRALLTLREAKLKLGENADNETAELAANFPMDADTAKYSSAKLSAEQKMVKLHALVFAYKYSLVDNVVAPEEIISSNVPRERKCKALYELGYGLRRNKGAAANAVAAFEGLLNEKCDRDFQARALYWIGFLGNAAGKDEEADSSLKKLAREFKGHRLQDDGYYMLYKRAVKHGDAALAQKYFSELMKLPKGDTRDKLAFETAFPYYTRKNFARAAAILEPIAGSEAADETFTQALYWYARSLEKMGGKKNIEKAMNVHERIVSNYPYSFYATLASERANVPLNFPALPKLIGKAPPDDEGFFALIDKLNSSGMRNAAKGVLDLAMNLHPEWETSNKEFITRKYIESQNYRKALDMAAQHFDSSVYGPVEPKSDPMFAAFFPQAFSEAVTKGYRLTDLPRGSIEGVMREESLFQTNVRSHAGALGLMQLMPKTAALVARGGNAGGASASNLTRPADNVLLGSSYLASMRERFGDRMPLAIMAYNAGPGNVNKFLRNLRDLDLDEFIENIPIDETRGYVKRVMRSMRVYAEMHDTPLSVR